MKKGFTLLEVLVVVMIIGMLVALLMPAASTLRQTAKRKQAATRAISLIQAIKSYRQVYGKFPGQVQDIKDQDVEPEDLIHALTNNPRGTYFLEFADNELDSDGALLDPWEMRFVVSMDENGDKSTDLKATSSGISFSTNVPGESICVMSWGGKPSDKKARVYSWIR
jgi:prepilin-type N-terminal cleavage/methylation domain-containing protein